MSSGPRISLVLGSGGARGLAHIGVIRYLQTQGVHIASISGSSMGALVGGIYAAGRLEEYRLWVEAITRMDILRLLDLTLHPAGLVKGDRIIATLKAMVGERRIEDLPIAFTAVATDIGSEREVWFDRGPLFDAIRASISLPVFFTPVERDGRVFLDGGIVNPVPIAPTFNDHTDLTIAVNVNGGMQRDYRPPRMRRAAEPDRGIAERIQDFIAQLQGEDGPSTEAEWNMLDVINRSLDIMQGAIARQQLAAYPPDHLVEIPKNACQVLEFYRAREMIALGFRAARERLGPVFAADPP